MRKQYHFRESNQGLLAWDVNNLISLTHSLTPQSVDLTAITELNETYWYDLEEDAPTCRSIVEHCKLVFEADLAYPIILCPSGRLMDGMHRVVKALVLGKKTIMAYQLPVLPAPDFIDIKPIDILRRHK